RAKHLSGGRLSAALRRVANLRGTQGLVVEHNSPHIHSRADQEVHGWVSLQRASDGHAGWNGRRAVDLLYRCQGHLQSGIAPPSDLQIDREDADAGGVRVSAQRWDAVRLSR